ncbi:MAG: hypothetical protein ACK4NX_02220 [Candidatus Paceibacteria bacterium]
MRSIWRKIAILLLVLAPLFVAGAISSYYRRNALVEELNEVSRKVMQLKEENEKFHSFIKYFSLRANLEREIKASLNLARHGEILVIFVSPTPIPSPSIKEESTNIFQKFFQWLKK